MGVKWGWLPPSDPDIYKGSGTPQIGVSKKVYIRLMGATSMLGIYSAIFGGVNPPRLAT
jgi:hypothetical protein